MQDTLIQQIIFQYLYEKKAKPESLNSSQLKDLFKISKNKFIGGFILHGNDLKEENQSLYRKLDALNKNFLKRKMIMMADLELIEKEFTKEKIRYVVMKGMAYEKQNLYKNNERQFRDIDILVDRENLKKAFKVLTNIGYRIKNKLAVNRCKYISDYHHLPLMINKNKTPIELHHRVTKKDIYEDCPLNNYFFENLDEKRKIPNKSGLIAHVLYHAFQHHKMSQGPIFLFDVSKLIEIDEPLDHRLLEKLRLDKKFNQIQKIKNDIMLKNKLDDNVSMMIANLTNNFNWDAKKQKLSLLSGSKNDKVNIKKITKKFKEIKFLYQVDYFSLRFFLLVMLELFLNLKKVRL